MTVETYTDGKDLQKTSEIRYVPPKEETNPYPKGTPKYYTTSIKLRNKTLIRAKLFLDQNIDRLEQAMEKDQIKEQDYIITMDTMMILKRVVIPHQEASIAFLKMINMDLNMRDVEIMANSQSMFNKIWMNIPSGRASDYNKEDDQNNLFNINNLSSMYLYMEHMKKTNQKQKNSPVVMGFKFKEIKLYKECLIKWEREIVHPVKAIIKKYI